MVKVQRRRSVLVNSKTSSYGPSCPRSDAGRARMSVLKMVQVQAGRRTLGDLVRLLYSSNLESQSYGIVLGESHGV